MEAAEYTYEDAGRACGVSAETIRHRAKRGKLQRGRPTNTGRPTVLLTEQDIAAISAGRPTVQTGGQTGGQPPDQNNTIRALEGEAAALRDALDRERVRVDRAEAVVDQQRAELAALHNRLERAEAEAAGYRDARDALARVEAEAADQRRAAEVATEQAQQLHREAMDGVAAARRELDAWKAMGPLRRALRALRHVGRQGSG